MTSPSTKTCRTCGKPKPIEDFYRYYKEAPARQNQCKTCRGTYINKWARDRRAAAKAQNDD